LGIYGVKNPVEAENWINDHGGVIHPYLFESQVLAQKTVFRSWVDKTWEELANVIRIAGAMAAYSNP